MALRVSVTEVESALRAAVGFLQRQQLPCGHFQTLVSTDLRMREGNIPEPSPFGTVLVALALLDAGLDEAATLVGSAADAVEAEMLPGGLWKFWNRHHPGFPSIPPDADDTACASLLLRRLGRRIPRNRDVFLSCRNAAGAFLTWFGCSTSMVWHPGAWKALCRAEASTPGRRKFFSTGQATPQDVGTVVNANVLAFLGAGSWSQGPLRWVQSTILHGAGADSDPWYQSSPALAHALLRMEQTGITVSPEVRHKVLTDMHRLAAAEDVSVRDRGLALATLAAWAQDVPHAALAALLQKQAPGGAWPCEAAYYGGWRRVRVWGSAEITTAAAVEALARWLRRGVWS